MGRTGSEVQIHNTRRDWIRVALTYAHEAFIGTKEEVGTVVSDFPKRLESEDGGSEEKVTVDHEAMNRGSR